MSAGWQTMAEARHLVGQTDPTGLLAGSVKVNCDGEEGMAEYVIHDMPTTNGRRLTEVVNDMIQESPAWRLIQATPFVRVATVGQDGVFPGETVSSAHTLLVFERD